MENLTPMMKQYFEIKEDNKDAILFFRLGDFYEMFFDDAIEASRILDIALTGKSCGLEERAPMCGVPFHSADSYIQKLIQAGKKVAICEQVEDPKTAKGLVKREVVRIITPGTNLDDNNLESHRNLYLMSIGYSDEEGLSYSYLDLSTGEFYVGELDPDLIADTLAQVSPDEIIISRESECIFAENVNRQNQLLQYVNSKQIVSTAYESKPGIMNEFFEDSYIKDERTHIKRYQSSIELILTYIYDTQKKASKNISKVSIINKDSYMKIDLNTRKNLELTENINTKSKKNSLFDVIDYSKTNIGKRTLRKWIEKPLVNINDINRRLDSVEEFIGDFQLREDCRDILSKIYDIERLSSKISYETINIKEIMSLKSSIMNLPLLISVIQKSDCKKLKKRVDGMDDLRDIYEYIDEVIMENPSPGIKDGEVINSSFNKELEEYRYIESNASKILQELEQEERERTQIKNLKIGYNKVFGYYIEITNSNLRDFEPPVDYIRKQTLSNAERYISEKLKIVEDKILTARQKIYEIQSDIFSEFKSELYKSVNRIQSTASIIGEVDAICSLASAAVKNNLTRPEFNSKGLMEIKDSRHPVVEKILGEENFVPNDAFFDEDSRIHIITGPNMGGKSTYMRQIAIISIMAHIGSFVSASYANVPVLDAVYTRVGASDDLSQGQSTFMVEMNEVSYILRNATSKSLVLLDEVGRGTSTFDGLSIAWAILKHISTKLNCITLFSTHYHEITELEGEFQNIKNYYVSVDEREDTIVFMRKIFRGKIDKSYGIHVAKLAGIPDEVIFDANLKLEELEVKENEIQYENKLNRIVNKKDKMQNSNQISIFEFNRTGNNGALESRIENIDIDTTTPVQALNILNELKNMLR